MADDPSIWAQIGVKLADLVGGAAGGTAGAMAFRKGIYSITTSMIVGTLTAGWLTSWFSEHFGNFAGGAAFIVGAGAMTICQWIVIGVSRWLPKEQSK